MEYFGKNLKNDLISETGFQQQFESFLSKEGDIELIN